MYLNILDYLNEDFKARGVNINIIYSNILGEIVEKLTYENKSISKENVLMWGLIFRNDWQTITAKSVMFAIETTDSMPGYPSIENSSALREMFTKFTNEVCKAKKVHFTSFKKDSFLFVKNVQQKLDFKVGAIGYDALIIEELKIQI